MFLSSFEPLLRARRARLHRDAGEGSAELGPRRGAGATLGDLAARRGNNFVGIHGCIRIEIFSLAGLGSAHGSLRA